MFIGIFIFLGAGNEASYESTQAVLSRYRVADVLMRQFTTLHVWDHLDKAVALLLNGQEKEFLVEEDNRIVGVLTREDIIRGLQESKTDTTVGRIAKTVVVQLSLDMSLKDAFEQMAKAGIAISPVYENEELVGVVNQENIMELLMVQEAMKGSQQSAVRSQQSMPLS
ncbi:MAG: CBS domain-containing protein [Saprospiraceae bacterium]|nr:CBS domain-containing protein [Saprospiraceae bacterium]